MFHLSFKSAALIVSVILHGALAVFLTGHFDESKAKIKGGIEVQPVQLGNSFNDLVASVNTHNTQDLDRLKPARSETVKPIVPKPVTSSAQAMRPKILPSKSPLPAKEAEKASATIQKITPLKEKPKQKDPQKPKAKKQKSKPKAADKQAKPRGNSNNNAKKGKTTGTKQGKAANKSDGNKASKQSGNAAVQNYGGVIMRCIASKRKVKSKERGVVQVRFSISNTGSIQAVALAKSSGKSRLDRAALDSIRRVRRCPAPPTGAKKNFTIQVQSK